MMEEGAELAQIVEAISIVHARYINALTDLQIRGGLSMSTVKNEVSPAAAKKIVEAIRFKLYEYGLENSKEAKSMAIGVAAIVKRIVLEDATEKNGPTAS